MQHQQPNQQFIWLHVWIASVKCAGLGWSAASKKPVSCRMWPNVRSTASKICQILIKCRKMQLGLRFHFRETRENRKPLCRRETFQPVTLSEREPASHQRPPKCYKLFSAWRCQKKSVNKLQSWHLSISLIGSKIPASKIFDSKWKNIWWFLESFNKTKRSSLSDQTY